MKKSLLYLNSAIAVVLLISMITLSCCHYPVVENDEKGITVSPVEKQRGVHVFGRMDSTTFEDLNRIHADYITLVPYAGQNGHDSPEIRYFRSEDPAQNKERNDRWVRQIEACHEAGFKVFIKPHIWIRNASSGKWRSDIYYDNEEEWNTWSKNYRSFILHYAELSEQANVEMFCIGTELTRLSKGKPEFWRALIKDVKLVYTGKLTYAGNWYKEYESISFWDELDYIGIQAYFPLTNKNNPETEELKQAWERKSSDFAAISKRFNKPILFTEIGYKSTTDGASKPWEWVDYYNNGASFEQSDETQANAYQSVFETIWDEPWFAGIHLWQWRGDGRNRRGRTHLDFTPQNKPAEQIIAEGFKR